MPLLTEGRNDVLTNGLTAFTHVGALTALQTTEVVGGSYARQAVTFTAAAAGVRDNNAQLSIPIPAGTTVVATACYDALSAGNQESYQQIGSTKRGVGTVVSTVGDAISSNGHTLSNTNRVFLAGVAGEALPAGLNATTIYFVVGATTDTFQLSLTSGGAAVDITALGDLAWFETIPEMFTNAGNLIIPINQLDIDANFV